MFFVSFVGWSLVGSSYSLVLWFIQGVLTFKYIFSALGFGGGGVQRLRIGGLVGLGGGRCTFGAFILFTILSGAFLDVYIN